MTISLRQFEFIMSLVIEWANDVPFATWYRMLVKIHDLHELDTKPDYQITLVNGKPYLYDSLLGGIVPSWNTSEPSSWTAITSGSPKSSLELTDWNISERSNLDEIE